MPVKELIQTVSEYLRTVHPGGSNLEIVEEGVSQHENSWIVPIQPDVQPTKTFEYYEALANLTVKLLMDKDINVMFKPVVNGTWVTE